MNLVLGGVNLVFLVVSVFYSACQAVLEGSLFSDGIRQHDLVLTFSVEYMKCLSLIL